jgi:electron transfer flavoprotein alpha subunit
MGIEIVRENCVGCGMCVPACPFGAISMVDGKASVGPECTLCGACVKACRFDAIEFERPKGRGVDKSQYSGIWVYCEVKESKLMGSALQLLSKARELSKETGEEVSALILGKDTDDHVVEISEHGADAIHRAEIYEPDHYDTDTYSSIVSGLILKHKPSIVLFPASHTGRDLAPRVASTLGIGLTADCTGLSIDGDGNLVQSRPAFGGNIMADIITPDHRPQMATVRPNVFRAGEPVKGREARIFDVPVKIENPSLRVIIKEVIKTAESGGKDLTESDIIISGGGGLRGAENFGMLEELAEALGGVVGASRVAVDSGWRPRSDQVGQTGKTVSPRLYIACGISGKIQHQVGMKSSELIIAINKDPDAPIFKIADYGIVGDLFEIIPAMTGEIRNRSRRS